MKLAVVVLFFLVALCCVINAKKAKFLRLAGMDIRGGYINIPPKNSQEEALKACLVDYKCIGIRPFGLPKYRLMTSLKNLMVSNNNCNSFVRNLVDENIRTPSLNETERIVFFGIYYLTECPIEFEQKGSLCQHHGYSESTCQGFAPWMNATLIAPSTCQVYTKRTFITPEKEL